ncbi:hypothetical protein BCR34DRAFT_552004 [Clohesyomyces aquaticus]|uniref:Uncharacterized protein n=1 Tax=Clohesyomyces aquaticus TaxID=1231657 RepID=A0A1Y2AA83_9PLEO|nr:hypothetical protein BCR34DRAFT_552004 [Clohesyomyces aquaticus]
MIEAIVDRISESTTTNHNEPSPVSAVDLGLVPDFSRPIGWGSFYDRYGVAGITPEDLYSSSSSDSPDTDSLGSQTPLPNGVPPSRPSTRSPNPNPSPSSTLPARAPSHSRPTGLPPLNLANGLSTPTLLSPDPPSPPLSQTYASLFQESTLATQTQLIHDLHTIIDDLRARNQNLEERTLPQLESLVERHSVRIEELEALVGALDEEVGDLRAVLDWCGGLLRRAWEREEEVVGWCDGVEERRREARGLMRLVLQTLGKRNTWGTVLAKVGKSMSARRGSRNVSETIKLENLESGAELQNQVLGRTELGDVAWLAERNLRMLKEEIEGMADLVTDFMNKYQGVSDEESAGGSPLPGSVRDV